MVGVLVLVVLIQRGRFVGWTSGRLGQAGALEVLFNDAGDEAGLEWAFEPPGPCESRDFRAVGPADDSRTVDLVLLPLLLLLTLI